MPSSLDFRFSKELDQDTTPHFPIASALRGAQTRGVEQDSRQRAQAA